MPEGRAPTGAARALPGSSRGRSRGRPRGHSLTGLGASLVSVVFPPHCGVQTPKALSCLEVTALRVFKKLHQCRRARWGQQVALFLPRRVGACSSASRQHGGCSGRGLCRLQASADCRRTLGRTTPLPRRSGPRPWTRPCPEPLAGLGCSTRKVNEHGASPPRRASCHIPGGALQCHQRRPHLSGL